MGGNQSRLGKGNAAGPSGPNERAIINQRSSSLDVPENSVIINKSLLRRQKSEGWGSGSTTTGTGTLVVVKKPDLLETFDINKDPVILRLQEIPMPEPIYINKDKLQWSAEGERARGKLDPSPLLNLGLLLQTRTRSNIILISKQQNKLSQRIKDTDKTVQIIFQSYTGRQKSIGKLALQLNKITDFAHSLIKCQGMLNECKRLSSVLNNMLPPDERLEPFHVEEPKELQMMEFVPKDLTTLESDSPSSVIDVSD